MPLHAALLSIMKLAAAFSGANVSRGKMIVCSGLLKKNVVDSLARIRPENSIHRKF